MNPLWRLSLSAVTPHPRLAPSLSSPPPPSLHPIHVHVISALPPHFLPCCMHHQSNSRSKKEYNRPTGKHCRAKQYAPVFNNFMCIYWRWVMAEARHTLPDNSAHFWPESLFPIKVLLDYRMVLKIILPDFFFLWCEECLRVILSSSIRSSRLDLKSGIRDAILPWRERLRKAERTLCELSHRPGMIAN